MNHKIYLTNRPTDRDDYGLSRNPLADCGRTTLAKPRSLLLDINNHHHLFCFLEDVDRYNREYL